MNYIEVCGRRSWNRDKRRILVFWIRQFFLNQRWPESIRENVVQSASYISLPGLINYIC